MKKISAIILVLAIVLFSGCVYLPEYSESISEVEEYKDSPYVVVNDNIPEFTEDDYTTKSYERYSKLDRYDRCGVAMACISTDLMPTEDRGSISHVKPSGWVNNSYDFIDGEYLYNRCHLIGFQLTGENANERNLITGTRYLNTEGMLPFENMVADYIKETENHVLYRVTPVYEATNLVASGVQMEAWSVEDDGEGICFNVYCYNIQPGVEIDYATGDNWESSDNKDSDADVAYVLNTNTGKFHLSTCGQVKNMDKKNKEETDCSRDELIQQGYEPAGCCKP